MFLTEAEFLSHFPTPSKKITRDEFADLLTVTYKVPQTLNQLFRREGKRPVIKRDDDRRLLRKDDIIDYFYDIVIRNRHKYLKCFYGAYFTFKDPQEMEWERLEITKDPKIISMQRNDASRRLVRNLYYLELLDLTKVTNTVKSKVSFWQSLVNLYNNFQLEDRFFAPSSIDLFLRPKNKKNPVKGEINYNNLFYLFQAYQPKASIFNPYTIKYILDYVLQPMIKTNTAVGELSLFTPVLSWSSYLFAFMHSQAYRHYVGVDVMPSVCKKTQFLFDWYKNPRKTLELHCTPSESLLTHKEFRKARFDCVLLCPPYYNMETYHEGQQSTESYQTYESWLQSYWEATVEVCYNSTKKGAVFAFIGNNFNDLNGKYYRLADDLLAIAKKYFEFKEMFYLQNRTSPLRVNVKDRTERLFILQKT